MKRLVFTFGTLYEPSIISSLLGKVPRHFLASVKGYSIFKGTEKDAPEVIRKELSENRDMKNFSFLFAKKSVQPNDAITGKAYEITTSQELILDNYERYPTWYRKEGVEIEDEKGRKHQGFMYAIDKGGEKVERFERVNGDMNFYIESGEKIRKKILEEFPNIHL
ncbi:hypothetical protein A3A93_00615 [Candidatus Roizmanbacteria bacterium RIFCSPLOWO2_01_FULL_38_12]|uniref:Gamma-glutamylcyclotransferase AIG2-like domain-containing protein n=1 Tax=Candidatus Roizmanbacteria bacterium RIFCSPLOWO2_01_FULL_38_12 TaxID=1802061 RepID=A0A1F7J064_9BACT|nr:MAG: hypothetical protein A2861_00050 [Candidatus Roizmanbacteria bacterium RIFCSPHIGHO2_01_FULL_38_15]OGK36086.1 MAG: hypothetical protein A3F59_01290 [Candidatus Roizmanbacteria bacterium RIFCSPHIGHO2_12_FULL_38_13]OGK48998.1 MAG: hypothetical protein A3A93_00615 [Candidatus Roizmanbacteria bacterium RIFCSPLOWO2_01_FULL_38_12]